MAWNNLLCWHWHGRKIYWHLLGFVGQNSRLGRGAAFHNTLLYGLKIKYIDNSLVNSYKTDCISSWASHFLPLSFSRAFFNLCHWLNSRYHRMQCPVFAGSGSCDKVSIHAYRSWTSVWPWAVLQSVRAQSPLRSKEVKVTAIPLFCPVVRATAWSAANKRPLWR